MEVQNGAQRRLCKNDDDKGKQPLAENRRASTAIAISLKERIEKERRGARDEGKIPAEVDKEIGRSGKDA